MRIDGAILEEIPTMSDSKEKKKEGGRGESSKTKRRRENYLSLLSISISTFEASANDRRRGGRKRQERRKGGRRKREGRKGEERTGGKGKELAQINRVKGNSCSLFSVTFKKLINY